MAAPPWSRRRCNRLHRCAEECPPSGAGSSPSPICSRKPLKAAAGRWQCIRQSTGAALRIAVPRFRCMRLGLQCPLETGYCSQLPHPAIAVCAVCAVPSVQGLVFGHHRAAPAEGRAPLPHARCPRCRPPTARRGGGRRAAARPPPAPGTPAAAAAVPAGYSYQVLGSEGQMCS